MATSLADRMSYRATTLSDEQLQRELYCAQQCILRMTRARRDLAFLQMRVVRQEMERRQTQRAPALTVVPALSPA